MKHLKAFLSLAVVVCMALSLVPAASAADTQNTHVIVLNSTENKDGSYTHSATYDGKAVTEYDYTWHADPSEDHGEVKNAPAEYYTGTEPGDEAVYIAHDVYYYPELDADKFVKVNYDGDPEWAYYYTAEGYQDYIFSTLPVSGSDVPTSMMHSEEEAYQNAVLHITEAGTYILKGQWHGQIWIDLGDTDDTFADESAKVTIILNGVNVTCTVAPALVFYSVYECDNTWEDQTSWSSTVDTSNAGANVIIADGTTNNFSGENVYRMLKTKYKDDSQQSGTGVKLQKKMRKLDGAFYSYVSMNISGETKGTGVLNINAGYEGLDSELHLTLNGGNVNIFSQDDGINVNEDGVSVVTVNGGSLHILAGLGSEGDGIDSNGFLVINGGTVISVANPNSDSGLDSDCGSYVNGGTVVALGSTMDWADDSNESGQVTMNLQFSGAQNADEAIIITDTNGKVVFAYDPDKDEVAGSNSRWYQGAVISCKNLEVGKSYFVYVGGDVYGTETAGVYDVSTVTGFTSDAKQQSYTGTDVGGPGGMGGGFGGGARPDDGTMPDGQFDPGQNGQRPDGEPDNGPGQMGQRPDGQPDNGTDPGQNGQRPDGESGGARPDEMGGQPGGTAQSGQAASVYFTMSDQVNGFSGVTDYDGTNADANTDANTGNPNTVTFTDVPADAWYESAVRYVYEKGLMTGTSTTTFSPTRTTTRAMIVTILYRLEGSPTVSGSSIFSDVSAGQYYSDAVAWASANGIVTGYSDGRFNPGSLLTRQQLATILYRYAAYKGYDVTADTDLSAYTDAASVSNYAQAAMAWANGNGLINGTTTTTLTPAGSATRAQVAAILMRFCESSLSK